MIYKSLFQGIITELKSKPTENHGILIRKGRFITAVLTSLVTWLTFNQLSDFLPSAQKERNALHVHLKISSIKSHSAYCL